MEPLVATPLPYPTESLWGFLLRLSEANGYDTPARILAYMGVSESQRHTSTIPLENLARLLAQSTFTYPQISYYSPVEQSRSSFLLGHSLGVLGKNAPLRLHNPAFCPDCVRENGYVDAFWHLTFAVACQKHKRESVNQCGCGKKLTWNRPGLLLCRCEQNLADLPATAVAETVTNIMSVLWNKVHNTPLSTVSNPGGFPLQHLDRMSLLNFLRLMRLLSGHNLRSQGIDENVDNLKLVAAAAEVLENWPTAFHAMLRRIEAQEREERPHSLGFSTCHKRLVQSLFQGNFQSDEYDFLREELTRYGSEIWEGLYRRRVGTGDHERGQYISLSEFARGRKMTVNTASKWLKRGIFDAHATTVGGTTRYLVNAANLDPKKCLEGTPLRLRAAAKYVGLTEQVLCDLRDTQHYERDALPTQQRLLYKHDLDRLLFKMLSCAKVVDRASLNDDTVISLNYVLTKLQFWSVKKVEFVVAYLDGALKSIGRCGETTADIYFRKEDAKHFIQKCRALASGGSLSQQEAADKLQCRVLAIPGLIQGKYLEPVLLPRKTRVTSESLAAFAEKYSALLPVAKRWNTTVSRLTHVAKAKNISLLVVPDRRGENSPFVLQKDVMRLEEVLRGG